MSRSGLKSALGDVDAFTVRATTSGAVTETAVEVPASATTLDALAAIAQAGSPTVTVAIPALNEEAHIEGVVRSFLASPYPGLRKVVVADGGSTDRTRAIVLALRVEDERVELVENPERVQSAGLNRILERCDTDLFLRADAHCIYADDYVERSVEAVTSSGALNAGGAQRFVAASRFQSYVSVAAHSALGSGRSRYRDPDYTGFAETMFIGCYRTATLKSLDGFRVDAAPNEDSELNIRLHELQKDAVYVSSAIKAYYFPRSSVRALARQYFAYGFARRRTIAWHGDRQVPLRARLPLILLGVAIDAALALALLAPAALVPALAAGVGGVLSLLCVDNARSALRLRRRTQPLWRGAPGREPSIAEEAVGGMLATLVLVAAFVAGQLRYLVTRGGAAGRSARRTRRAASVEGGSVR